MKGWTPADLPPMISTLDGPSMRLTILEPPACTAQRDDRIPGTPLPDFKRHNHNAKLKGWQKGMKKK